ncbi:helix-turn-helix domain-containing protein [Microbacterium sp. BWT-B31]|uniref:IclR family transcriptional regulator n=1 Tax=Microbacterium sp. BWT-B31 TaxID=3232072 RepID=UPI0035276086
MQKGQSESAVGKALDLLDAVAGATQSLTLSELADRTGMNRPTALRVLRELVNRGWLLRIDAHYLPGSSLLRLSAHARQRSLAALARPHLERLSTSIGLMVNVQTLEAEGSRILDAVRPERYRMLDRMIGDLLPVHQYAGAQALVAHLDDDARSRHLDHAEALGMDASGRADLIRQLDEARERGYVIVLRGSPEVAASVARAVTDTRGLPVCAITAVGFDDDLTEPRLSKAISALETAGAGILTALRSRAVEDET